MKIFLIIISIYAYINAYDLPFKDENILNKKIENIYNFDKKGLYLRAIEDIEEIEEKYSLSFSNVILKSYKAILLIKINKVEEGKTLFTDNMFIINHKYNTQKNKTAINFIKGYYYNVIGEYEVSDKFYRTKLTSKENNYFRINTDKKIYKENKVINSIFLTENYKSLSLKLKKEINHPKNKVFYYMNEAVNKTSVRKIDNLIDSLNSMPIKTDFLILRTKKIAYNLYLKIKDYDKALSLLKEIDPENNKEKARLYALNGNYIAAINLMKELKPNANILHSIGKSYTHLKDYKTSIKYLNKAKIKYKEMYGPLNYNVELIDSEILFVESLLRTKNSL